MVPRNMINRLTLGIPADGRDDTAVVWIRPIGSARLMVRSD